MANTIKGFYYFLIDIFQDRDVLWGLSKNDFKARFASSFLGGIWSFIQPLVTLLVMWFVFQVGFKNPPVSGVPFIAWLMPAYIVWSFFSETLGSGTNCMMEYSYLVKKMNFRVSMLPMVKIISSAYVHVGLIAFLLIVLLFSHVPYSVYNVQVIYYFTCTCLLLLGLCWLLSALAPFVKDVVNIVGVIIQIGFWATPIFWSPERMSPAVQNLLKINPMFYICRGYRDSFVDNVWFWQRGYTNIVFWVETLILLVAGALLFKRLRPQFADVL